MTLLPFRSGTRMRLFIFFLPGLLVASACRTYHEEVKIIDSKNADTPREDDPLRTSLQSSFRINKLDPKPSAFDKVKISLKKLEDKQGDPLSSKDYDDYQIGTLLLLVPNAWYRAEIEVLNKGKVVGENKSCKRELLFKAEYGENARTGKLCPEPD